MRASRHASRRASRDQVCCFLVDDERRLARARTFDQIAELYDRARPYYREEMFDDLFQLAGLEPTSARILEIGCGTGRATEPLARRGAEIVCVELGPNLARIAAEKLAAYPRVSVVTANFETWESQGRQFDIVFAATAWHWIDPDIRYRKAAQTLRPSGFLAFTTGAHAFPADVDPFFLDIQAAYDAIGMHWPGPWPPPSPEEMPDARDEIEASGLFDEVRVVRYLWTDEYSAQSHVALMQTASDHRLIEETKREWLFSEMRRLIALRPGGCIIKHQLTLLHLARKKTLSEEPTRR
jgi:SAM-dependent methyltransferase